MPQKHVVPITNGVGSKEIVDGQYDVTATAEGYDSASLQPEDVTITSGVNLYQFTMEAEGTLTLHVTEDGTATGTPIVGATFVRCDAQDNSYGTPIVSNGNGNAEFEFVPYDGTVPPTIYFKQTNSDGAHTFDDTLQHTTMDAQTKTVEIANPLAPIRNFKLTDANYPDLPIEEGELTLTA